jgi:hypothetical protein
MKKISPQQNQLSTDTLKVTVSVYALRRVAKGLAGLPTHAGRGGKIGLAVIAREIGAQSVSTLLPIRQHLDALARVYRVEDPGAAVRARAVDVLQKHYGAQPLPGRRDRPHLSRIASETGIHRYQLNSTEFRAAIAALVAANGLAQFVPDAKSEMAALQAFDRRLRCAGAELPRRKNGQIALAAISKATGVPTPRLKQGAVAAELARLTNNDDLPIRGRRSPTPDEPANNVTNEISPRANAR